MNYIYVITLINLINFKDIYSMKCYQCNSDIDKSCEENPKKSTEPCEDFNGKTSTHCRKIYQILYFLPKKKYNTIRECGYSGIKEETQKLSTADYYVIFANCLADGCNKAPRRRGTNLFLWIVLLFMFIVIYPP